MTAPTDNAPAKLRHEILEEAGRQRDEILQRARDEADLLVAQAEREAAQIRKEKLASAETEAKRRVDAILATVSIESARLRAARTEALLESVRNRARDCVASRRPDGFRETLATLAGQAVTRMAGERFVMRFATADLDALGNGMLKEVRQRVGRPDFSLNLIADPELRPGEVIVQDEEGHQVWPIGLEVRLQRLWPELRRQIAACAAFTDKDTSAGGQS